MSNDNPTIENASLDEEHPAIEENLKSRSTWLRGLFMLLCCALLSLAGFVGSFVVVLGFLWVLFTGEKNRQLQQAGQSIATYVYEIARFLTFNTGAMPFPFGGSWPSGKPEHTD